MPGSFSADISAWIAKAKGNRDQVLRKIALDMFSRVILRTPVDKGRARGNWHVSIGRVDDNVLQLDDKAGTATISAAAAHIAQVKAGDVIYLINNLPYIGKLESGSSKQAPAGMVEITVQEFSSLVGRAAAEVNR